MSKKIGALVCLLIPFSMIGCSPVKLSSPDGVTCDRTSIATFMCRSEADHRTGFSAEFKRVRGHFGDWTVRTSFGLPEASVLVARAADVPGAFSVIKAIQENDVVFDHAAFNRRLSAIREADERERVGRDRNDSPNPDRKQLTSLEGDPRFAELYQPLQWESPADSMREGLADIRSGGQWALAPSEGG